MSCPHHGAFRCCGSSELYLARHCTSTHVSPPPTPPRAPRMFVPVSLHTIDSLSGVTLLAILQPSAPPPSLYSPPPLSRTRLHSRERCSGRISQEPLLRCSFSTRLRRSAVPAGWTWDKCTRAADSLPVSQPASPQCLAASRPVAT